MRKIEIEKWETKIMEAKKDNEGNPVLGKDGKPELEEKIIKESLLDVISAVVLNPQTMPRGVKAFRHGVALANAFEEAEKTGVLILEEADYAFAKEKMEAEMPMVWGFNAKIRTAFEKFISAKEEKPTVEKPAEKK